MRPDLAGHTGCLPSSSHDPAESCQSDTSLGLITRREPVRAATRPCPYTRAMLSNRAWWPMKARRVVPVGPLRCLATITSAVPWVSVASGL